MFLTVDDVLTPDDAVEMETKDESEEPVDLIPTLVPLPPDEVCICSILEQILYSQYLSSYPLSYDNRHALRLHILLRT